jgi:hypothetical protein
MTTLTRQIHDHNRRLDSRLRGQVGISLQTYKVIKNLTQLAGAAAGIYAMALGADPMVTFALIAGIITGPEAIEYALTHDPEG